jgi:hypothetical protein
MRACRRAAGAGAARLRGMAHTTRVLESGRRCCTLAWHGVRCVCVCVGEPGAAARLYGCMRERRRDAAVMLVFVPCTTYSTQTVQCLH